MYIAISTTYIYTIHIHVACKTQTHQIISLLCACFKGIIMHCNGTTDKTNQTQDITTESAFLHYESFIYRINLPGGDFVRKHGVPSVLRGEWICSEAWIKWHLQVTFWRCFIIINQVLGLQCIAMPLYNCDSYLLVPCWGRGCRGGCPCGRGAATRGAPSRGTGTAATRPGSARGRSVYKVNIVDKRHCTVAQLCIILNNLRVSSVQITESRHSNVPAPAAGSSDFYTSLRRAFLGHFILPFAIYLLYCHKSPLRPMISRIVCGRQKVLCSCCLCVTQSVSYSAAVVWGAGAGAARVEMLSHLPDPSLLWSHRNSIWIWSGCWRLYSGQPAAG